MSIRLCHRKAVNVIEENGRLRLFYCGNGYGSTGIGSVVAEKLA